MIEVLLAEVLPVGVEAIGIPVRQVEGKPDLPDMADASPSDPHRPREMLDRVDWSRRAFTAGVGTSFTVVGFGGNPDIVALGIGADPNDGSNGVATEPWRRAGAALVRATKGSTTVAVEIVGMEGDVLLDDRVGAFVEGAALATYEFDAFRATKPDAPKFASRLVVVADGCEEGSPDWAAIEIRIKGSLRSSSAVAWAKDLINTPPSDLPPRVLGERVEESLRGQPGIDVEIWDEHRIAGERLGALLGVSRGSTEPPVLVWARYDPVAAGNRPVGDLPVPHVVLVGKGITFDSGGLSLKTADGMTTMKTDMSGAAIVLAVLGACTDLGIKIAVSVLAPVAENMPGGGAVKPGDVVRTRSGRTIEILNTDAEGRLVLADALSLVSEMDPRPDAVVDVATLTGAASVALGNGIGALFGNNDSLLERVGAAGKKSGEQLWPMPMPEEYADHIESDIADMKNTGRAGQAGAISAALLLGKFTEGFAWAHLDIAGPGRSDRNAGYVTKGATAFGVRALIELVSSFEAEVD